MAHSIWNRETLLDVSVNVIPLVILVFFAVLLVVSGVYPPNAFVTAVAVGLHVVPFVVLAVVTWLAARVI